MGTATWLTVALFVIELVVGIYLYSRALRDKKPSWSFRTFGPAQLSQKLLEKLDMPNQESLPPYTAVTVLLFWNRGRGVIQKDDVVRGLCVHLGKSRQLLKAPKLLKFSRDEIGFEIVPEQNTVGLSFDFLDHNDGAIIEMIHSDGRIGMVHVEGTIKGGKIEHSSTSWFPPSEGGIDSVIEWGLIAFLVALPIPLVFEAVVSLGTPDRFWFIESFFDDVMMIVVALLGWAAVAMIAHLTWLSSKVPNWARAKLAELEGDVVSHEEYEW